MTVLKRVLVASQVLVSKSRLLNNTLLITKLLPRRTSLIDVVCKVVEQKPALGLLHNIRGFCIVGHRWIHSGSSLKIVDNVVEPANYLEKCATEGASGGKVKRKKLKGKRAVVRWLKFFRWKKKREIQRMTAEEKILYKLRKAQNKQEKIIQSLKKIEPADSSEPVHDPEVLTPEEHFYFLKMGLKSKNYVPVGRRGIYQGVILNMHLHWKKHQTLKVVVKTFSPEEVKEIACELARLTGGIVLDIHEENTIIMYRGKNYVQPPTEIMSPRVTLSRKKALDKSKYRDALRALKRYIPRLEQELELLQAQHKSKVEKTADSLEEAQQTYLDSAESGSLSTLPENLKGIVDGKEECSEDDPGSDLEIVSDSEDLSDIFETDLDIENEEVARPHLYLDKFEKFPVEANGETEDFEVHLRQISLESENGRTEGEDTNSPSFDEVDRMFLRAASLLRKKKRE
ncbi:hypothetical protein K2173_018284 [Erythroxylum novogranatense]|uniref:CRM domain-containing protein n=1 Tax=Erythroxylum novogranatense TaxID=1862640 RepID=A0AAV8U9Z4_9ROSI|nr:hypothetical protein K2173_018284 [Erythroxylum novogranatense]